MLVKPSLLFISPRFLFPMDQGGKIRTGNILRGLKGGVFSVTLASPAPNGHQRHADEIEAACDRFLFWPEEHASQLRRVLALTRYSPVAVETDQSATGTLTVLEALCEKPDVLVVDFPHTDVLVPSRIDVCRVMFTHNVEAEIFERHVFRSTGLRRLIWIDQSSKMARFEQAALSRYDSVIAVSARDRGVLAQRYQLAVVEAIDTGVDLELFTMNPPDGELDPGSGTLVFVATMSWAANVDGIHFLLDEVWPLLLAKRPNIRAVIIGRNPPLSLSDKIKERGLNVTLTGFVDNIRPYVANANVYVIPLFVGSGTRIKAFEAMALGRPVVSTTLGLEGLNVTDGKHFLRGDDAQAFAQSILRLLGDASLRGRIAGAARALMEEQFSWSRVARQFEGICERALAAFHGRRSG